MKVMTLMTRTQKSCKKSFEKNGWEFLMFQEVTQTAVFTKPSKTIDGKYHVLNVYPNGSYTWKRNSL